MAKGEKPLRALRRDGAAHRNLFCDVSLFNSPKAKSEAIALQHIALLHHMAMRYKIAALVSPAAKH